MNNIKLLDILSPPNGSNFIITDGPANSVLIEHASQIAIGWYFGLICGVIGLIGFFFGITRLIKHGWSGSLILSILAGLLGAFIVYKFLDLTAAKDSLLIKENEIELQKNKRFSKSSISVPYNDIKSFRLLDQNIPANKPEEWKKHIVLGLNNGESKRLIESASVSDKEWLYQSLNKVIDKKKTDF